MPQNETVVKTGCGRGAEHKDAYKVRLILITGLTALILFILLSISTGTSGMSRSELWNAIFYHDNENIQHLILLNIRIPRVLASALIGAALSVSGALMQGLTQNPLADSGLMGVNAGAGFAMALCFAFFPTIKYELLIIFAFGGAAFGTLLVSGVAAASRRGATPMNLLVAGAAVSALLAALSQGIALVFHMELNILFWTVGGVADVTWQQFFVLAPVVLVALAASMLLSPSVSIINMGEEIAKGLGLRTRLIRSLGTLLILFLAGISVSIVGAVAFMGLIVPHIVRFLVGANYKRIIPVTAVLGALILVAADLIARMVSPPFEVPLGVITSLLGVPFFLYLSRRTRGKA